MQIAQQVQPYGTAGSTMQPPSHTQYSSEDPQYKVQYGQPQVYQQTTQGPTTVGQTTTHYQGQPQVYQSGKTTTYQGQPTYSQGQITTTSYSQGQPTTYSQGQTSYASKTTQFQGPKQAYQHRSQQQFEYPAGVYTQEQHYPATTTTTVNGQHGYTKAGEVMTQYRTGETITEATVQHERIIGERIVEHEVRVPKKVIREDVIEKLIIVPEKVVHEEIIEEVARVREKIVEIAKPIIQEKIVEVPEIEYVEKIVEFSEKVIQERIKEVPRIEVQERIIEVPKIVVQEKIIEVPEIEYREVPIEKIVEIPEIQEQVVTRHVPVPQYVEKPEPHYVTVEVPEYHDRNIPVPVEAISTFEYKLPRVRPVCKRASFPLYVPKFVEVIVPEEMMDSVLKSQTERLTQQVSLLTSQAAPSLCEIENVAAEIHRSDFQKALTSDYHAAIADAWRRGLVGRPNTVVPRGEPAAQPSYSNRGGNAPVQDYLGRTMPKEHRSTRRPYRRSRK